MTTPVVPRYSEQEREFMAIRDMDIKTQYISANGKVYSYCLLRQLADFLGLMQFEIVRNLFRRCCSENIITARENLQRKIVAYENVEVKSELLAPARKKLIQDVEAKFNSVVDRINQARDKNGLSKVPEQTKFDPNAIEARWQALEKEITRRRLNEPVPASAPSISSNPLLSSQMFAPPANAVPSSPAPKSPSASISVTPATGKRLAKDKDGDVPKT